MRKLLKRLLLARRCEPTTSDDDKKPKLSVTTQRNLLRVFIDSRRVS